MRLQGLVEGANRHPTIRHPELSGLCEAASYPDLATGAPEESAFDDESMPTDVVDPERTSARPRFSQESRSMSPLMNEQVKRSGESTSGAAYLLILHSR
jgi:hypothetical protein